MFFPGVKWCTHQLPQTHQVMVQTGYTPIYEDVWVPHPSPGGGGVWGGGLATPARSIPPSPVAILERPPPSPCADMVGGGGVWGRGGGGSLNSSLTHSPFNSSLINSARDHRIDERDEGIAIMHPPPSLTWSASDSPCYSAMSIQTLASMPMQAVSSKNSPGVVQGGRQLHPVFSSAQ